MFVLCDIVLWVGCQAGGLRGVGRYESSKFEGVSVSMAGGGLLNIAAQDMAFDGAAIQNTLSLETSDIGGQSMTFDLPRLSGKFRLEMAIFVAFIKKFVGICFFNSLLEPFHSKLW